MRRFVPNLVAFAFGLGLGRVCVELWHYSDFETWFAFLFVAVTTVAIVEVAFNGERDL